MPAFGLRRLWLLSALPAVLYPVPSAQAGYIWHYGSWQYGHHWREPRSQPARATPTLRKNNGFPLAMAQTIRACAEAATTLQKLPFGAVLETVQPNDDQRAALDRLRAAASGTAEKLKATCPKEVPAPLSDRLRTMRASLDAITAALPPLRQALAAADAALSEEEKVRLVSDSGGKDAAPHAKPAAAEAVTAADDRSDAVSLGCGQWRALLKSWPLDRLESGFSLSGQQRAALSVLVQAIHGAAAGLAASCHDESSRTPISRLDAEVDRADALRQLSDAIAPPLAAFVDTLNDEQHAQFNAALVVAPPRG